LNRYIRNYISTAPNRKARVPSEASAERKPAMPFRAW
jgi:hypothetical protein